MKRLLAAVLLTVACSAAAFQPRAGIWANLLYLKPGTREHFLENLARDWPELLPRYQRLYAGRAYLGKKEIEPVRREVADLRQRFEVADRRTVRLLPAPRDAQLELPLLVDPASGPRCQPEARSA